MSAPMGRDEAVNLARWVDAHDDGTPHPRVSVKPCAAGFYLAIRSTEVHSRTGCTEIVESYCQNVTDVLEVLGY